MPTPDPIALPELDVKPYKCDYCGQFYGVRACCDMRYDYLRHHGERILPPASTPINANAIPTDMVLVPREPTPKMVDATWNHEIDRNGGIESQNTRNRRIYAAMISATPPLNELLGQREEFNLNEVSGNPGQLASLEQRARELLAAEMGASTTDDKNRVPLEYALRAIIAALSAQPRGAEVYQCPRCAMSMELDLTAKPLLAERGLETQRRMRAVEALLANGWKWDSKEWTAPQPREVDPACPECGGGLLFECLFCLRGNYPPQPREVRGVDRSLRTLIADDGYAASFQTMGQYRAALLAFASQDAAATSNVAGRLRGLLDRIRPGVEVAPWVYAEIFAMFDDTTPQDAAGVRGVGASGCTCGSGIIGDDDRVRHAICCGIFDTPQDADGVTGAGLLNETERSVLNSLLTNLEYEAGDVYDSPPSIKDEDAYWPYYQWHAITKLLGIEKGHTTPPPGVDVGKLRELATSWQSEAGTAQRDGQHGIYGGMSYCADSLLAAIDAAARGVQS